MIQWVKVFKRLVMYAALDKELWYITHKDGKVRTTHLFHIGFHDFHHVETGVTAKMLTFTLLFAVFKVGLKSK